MQWMVQGYLGYKGGRLRRDARTLEGKQELLGELHMHRRQGVAFLPPGQGIRRTPTMTM